MSISELTTTIDMKKILLILPFLLILQADISAQVTAVMKISVRVVSGVNVEKVSNLLVSSNSENSLRGQLVITSSPNSEIAVTTSDDCTLVNELGETLTLHTNSVLDSNATSGAHHLSLGGQFPNKTSLSGTYKGNLVTTIVYL